MAGIRKDLEPAPPPPVVAEALRQHREWLESDGTRGSRIGDDGGEIDLQGLDLDGEDLSFALLVCTNLSECSLRGALLIGAEMFGAVLVNSDITGARFDYADLCGANMIGSDRRGTCFDHAATDFTIWSGKDQAAFRDGVEGRVTEFLTSLALAGTARGHSGGSSIDETATQGTAANSQPLDPGALAVWRDLRVPHSGH